MVLVQLAAALNYTASLDPTESLNLLASLRLEASEEIPGFRMMPLAVTGSSLHKISIPIRRHKSECDASPLFYEALM
jgi:hypothetical protein